MSLRQFPWFRLVLAALLFGAAIREAGKSMASDATGLSAFFNASAFSSIICLLAGCIVLATVLRRTIAQPLTGFIDRIYFGSDPLEESPPLNLRLVRAYRSEHCFQQAIDECQRQLECHALVPELWAELVLAHRAAANRQGEAESLDRALETLGMTRIPNRFAEILRARDNLPRYAPSLISQFNR